MSGLLNFLSSYWQSALIGVGVLAAVGYVHERDNRIRQEAVAEERLADFEEADAARQVLLDSLAEIDAELAREADRLERLEAEADSLRRVAERGVREASRRAVEAGEDLRATIDSVAVLDAGLGATMRVQLEEHLRADRETMAAVEEERGAARSVAERLRDQVGLWRGRFRDERGLRVSTEAALGEARAALESAAASQGASWTGRLLWAGAGAGAGALVVSLVR